MEPGQEPTPEPEHELHGATDCSPDPDLEPGVNWREAASGLALHRRAVAFRLVIVVVTVIYMCIAVSARRDASVGGFALLLCAAEMMTTAGALAGLWKLRAYAARDMVGGISFATLCLFGVIVAELWSTWFLWRVVQLTAAASHSTSMWDAPAIGDIMEQAKRAPYVQALAGIGGLLAVLCVLGGIRRITMSLNHPVVAQRAGTITAMVLVLGASYPLMQYLITSNHAAILVLGIAVYGLVVLCAYLGVLNQAAEAMRAGAQTTLPVAELRRD